MEHPQPRLHPAGWHHRSSSHVSAHAGGHACPHAHAAPLPQGSLTWTTPTLALSTHPALPHLTLVRRARRYANNPARSRPHPLAHRPAHLHTPDTPGDTHLGAFGEQAGRRPAHRAQIPHQTAICLPINARTAMVVNDAFDGGRICCARSERGSDNLEGRDKEHHLFRGTLETIPNPVQPRFSGSLREPGQWRLAIHYLRREQRLTGRDEKLPRTAARLRRPPARALGPRPPRPAGSTLTPSRRRAQALEDARTCGGRWKGRGAAGRSVRVCHPAQSIFHVCSPASFPEGPFLRSPSPPRSGAPGCPSLHLSLSSL